MRRFLTIALASAAVIAAGAANAADFTLRYSQHHSSESAVYKEVTLPLKEFIEKESGGRIEVKTFPNGTLHGNADGFKALTTDITDIAPAYPLYTPNSFHLAHGFFLPGAFESVYAILRATEEMYPKYLKSEYEALGIEVLYNAASAPYTLVTTKEVKSLDDLKGMKVRGAGGAVNKMVEAMGATPVTIPAAEMYSSFQQGIIDGVLVPTESIPTFRLQELAKYYLPLDLGRAGNIPFGLNRKTYDSMPADLKDVMKRAGLYGTLLYADFTHKGITDAENAMKEKGVVTLKFSDADKAKIADAQKILWDDFIAKNEKDGFPVKDFVADMQALSKEFGNMTREEFLARRESHPVEGLLP
ncbi:MAG: TRAP transporter substrate-binding protein DctP [Rhodobiaceae bacterium]|nr:TRAP transporter substrate-binding protein DctP [Rhodobiaceae bacterium]MCC0055614.1 TRAP transporter substrate-binding protein DctP [Rhodobiaceae bacterium]